ncbi:MAG: hypothetical protein ACFB6S_02095 [Geminicoccaceae bacterium]
MAVPVAPRIVPALERWSHSASESEERTVIVRMAPTLPAEAAQEALEAAGAIVESAGDGVCTARVTSKTLQAVGARPEVVIVDEPRQMFPRFGPR